MGRAAALVSRRQSLRASTAPQGEALSALLSKYLECVIAADQSELDSFFGKFIPRSKVRESVNALMSARELNFVHVGNRSLIQVTQALPARQTELRS